MPDHDTDHDRTHDPLNEGRGWTDPDDPMEGRRFDPLGRPPADAPVSPTREDDGDESGVPDDDADEGDDSPLGA
jgi:hypothetical protein